MRRFSRVSALAAVGAVAAGALVLGVAAPAQAVDIDLRAYQQTLPASVIDDLDLTTEEKTRLTNNTRVGAVGGQNVIPLPGTVQGPRNILPGALTPLLMLSDEIRGEYTSYSRDQPKPEWIDQAEWDACAQSEGFGFISDFFNGARDWTASMGGTDCNDVRAGWDLEKNPDYVPVGLPGGFTSYPFTVAATGAGPVSFLAPKWSNAISQVNRQWQDGYVVGVDVAGPFQFLRFELHEVTAAGATAIAGTFTLQESNIASNFGLGCGTVEYCFSPNRFAAANVAGAGAKLIAGTASYAIRTVTIMQSFSCSASAGQACTTIPSISPGEFSSTALGAPAPTGALARQVMLTTIKTESGGVFQCRTESFVETAPTIPRPCEPTVPPGEVITERITEVVPETDTGYVPGSNPSRGVTRTEVPDVVRDWQRDNDEDAGTLLLLDLELDGVGSCFDHPDECADWYNDPNKVEKYTCKYGGRTLDLAECVKYARIFKPDAVPGGTAYPQPGSSNPGAAPGGQTSTTPSPTIAPGTGVANPNQPRNCFPTGWGVLNPFEWVYKPVKCVLEWAFVPRDTFVQSQIKLMQAKWTGSSLVGLLAVLEQGQHMMLSGSGCAGPHVSLDIMGGSYSGNPLSACAEPMSGVATFSRLFTMVSAWVMAVASIARSVAGVVGFTKLGGE